MHELLHQVDHEEPSQHQDLGHGQTGVREGLVFHSGHHDLENKMTDVEGRGKGLTSLTSGSMWVRQEVRLKHEGDISVREGGRRLSDSHDAATETYQAGEQTYHHRPLLGLRLRNPTFSHSDEWQDPWRLTFSK